MALNGLWIRYKQELSGFHEQMPETELKVWKRQCLKSGNSTARRSQRQMCSQEAALEDLLRLKGALSDRQLYPAWQLHPRKDHNRSCIRKPLVPCQLSLPHSGAQGRKGSWVKQKKGLEREHLCHLPNLS